MGPVKTTVEIDDALFRRAKAFARSHGRTMRSLLEEGLRRTLESTEVREAYVLVDRSVGNPTAANPLEQWSWQDLRDEIYGGR
jgi:hypothetical protein